VCIVLSITILNLSQFPSLLNWCLSISRQGNSDPAHEGLISFKCPTLKRNSEVELFCHAAPAVWNSLPTEIADTSLSLATFKSRLKLYLYNQSFRCWSCYQSASAIWHYCNDDIGYVTNCVLLLSLFPGQSVTKRFFCIKNSNSLETLDFMCFAVTDSIIC